MVAQTTVRQGGREQHCRQRHGVCRAGRRKRSQETRHRNRDGWTGMISEEHLKLNRAWVLGPLGWSYRGVRTRLWRLLALGLVTPHHLAHISDESRIGLASLHLQPFPGPGTFLTDPSKQLYIIPQLLSIPNMPVKSQKRSIKRRAKHSRQLTSFSTEESFLTVR